MAGNHKGDLFQAMGGTAGCRKLSAAFYARVGRDPLLRPLFPGKTLTCAIAEFAAFLVQFLGGPSDDAQRRWWLSLRESHLRFKIGQKQRDAWMGHMVKALNDVQITEPVRSALRGFFEHSSAYVVNQGQANPVASTVHPEIARRWDVQLGLDEAVAAVRNGASPALPDCDRAVLAGLLGIMIRSGDCALLGYVRENLNQDPALVRERYAGRTLLHEAAGQGNLPMVELLLHLGADPNAPDGGRHPPLYCVGNECKVRKAEMWSARWFEAELK
jgi:hemoglobin